MWRCLDARVSEATLGAIASSFAAGVSVWRGGKGRKGGGEEGGGVDGRCRNLYVMNGGGGGEGRCWGTIERNGALLKCECVQRGALCRCI